MLFKVPCLRDAVRQGILMGQQTHFESRYYGGFRRLQEKVLTNVVTRLSENSHSKGSESLWVSKIGDIDSFVNITYFFL